MSRMLRIVGIAFASLVLIVCGAALYLLGAESIPEDSDYVIDRQVLAETARATPGPLPIAVSHVLIARATLPRAALYSGFDFSPQEMVHGAYQVLYADGSYVLIDSGFSRPIFDEMMARGGEGEYYAEAFARLAEAMPSARAIVLTHEHLDHIQGLGQAPDHDAIAERIVMPRAQYTTPSTAELLPAALMQAIEPRDYDAPLPIAPGVAVQPAPGHTPGSQLVFVKTGDAREYLFIGDVAWHMDMIRELEYRPRLVTDLMLGEDRRAVMAQIRTLHEMLDEGGLIIVSSHDRDQLDALQAQGLIGSGLTLGWRGGRPDALASAAPSAP